RLEMTLSKRIPVEAGLGGGSSDAASTIRALRDFWRLGLTDDELSEIGGRIGADVALFLRDGQSVIRGPGEQVTAAQQPIDGYVVLVVPRYGIATAAVYKALLSDEIGRSRPDPQSLRATSAEQLLPLLYNDLESPAFRIERRVAELHDQLQS